MLALAEHRRLRAGQDQRKAHREIRARYGADLRLLEIGQWRVTMKSSLATTCPSFTVTGARVCFYQSWYTRAAAGALRLLMALTLPTRSLGSVPSIQRKLA